MRSAGTGKIFSTNNRQITSLQWTVAVTGNKESKNKSDYVKKCGQSFWSFISGDDQLYTTIIEPLGHKAKERNEAFQVEYGKVINRFTVEFIKDFCLADGSIRWNQIVELNSEIPKPKIKKVKTPKT